MLMVVGLITLVLAGADPADDPPPETASAPTTVERGPPPDDEEDDEDDEDDEDEKDTPASATSATSTTSTNTAPVTPTLSGPADPADPADPVPPTTTSAPTTAATTTPTVPDVAASTDPADAGAAPTTTTTPHREPPPRRAPPDVKAITRSPSPDLRHPVVAGGIVAGAGCISALAPVAGFVACPYSFVAAPLTACCGTVGAAAVTESQLDAGDPVGTSIAAAVGVTAATAVGVVGGTGLYLLTGNTQNGTELVVGAMGGLFAMAILGPLAGGGAVAAYKSFTAPTAPAATMTKAP